MNSKDPILIVDDDADDCSLLKKAFAEAEIINPIVSFQSAIPALNYLKSTSEKIFLIISDVNMPLMDGMEFKGHINDDVELCKKAIPFIFLTTADTVHFINQAHRLCSQGYFQKPNSLDELVLIVRNIANYWNNNILLVNAKQKEQSAL